MPVDNTAALQALLNVGVVTLPAAQTYYVTGLTVIYNFHMNGCTINMTGSSGPVLTIGASSIQIDGGTLVGTWVHTSAGNSSGASGISGTNRDNVTITNMTIQNLPAYAINISGNNPTITYNTITEVGYIGIFTNSVTNNTAGGTVAYNTVDRSMIPNSWTSGNTQPAVALRGSSGGSVTSANWTIHDNTFKMPYNPIDLTAEGLEVRYISNCTIYNNICQGGSIGHSIITGCDNSTIHDCSFDSQSAEGLEIGSSNTTATNNTITNSLGDGILVDGTSQTGVTLDNNNVSSSAGHCIRLYTGTSSTIIKRCSLSIGANGKAGIYCTQSYNLTITDTNIYGNSHSSTTGIYFDTSVGQLTMIRGSIQGTTYKVVAYAAGGGTTTDNLSFSCVNQPGGFSSGDLTTISSGVYGSSLTFGNSGCNNIARKRWIHI